MRKRTLFTLAAALVVAAAFTATAEAKDTFYYMGNSVIQVVDGDTDAIVADIPVDGWVRESDFTADKKFLYVTAKRHLIHKVDLAANKVVHTADVNSDGWQRFILGFDLAPDGKSAYANMLSRTTKDGEVVIGTPVLAQVDLESGKILRSVEVPWASATIVSVKNGQGVYVIGQDIAMVDVSGKEMKVTGTYPMYEKMWNILPLWDYTKENGGLFVGNYYTPELMGLITIDTATGEIIDTPLEGIPCFAYSLILSPDKKKAYAVMDELNVIDLEKKTYGEIVPMHEGTAYAVNITSDGKKVYAAGGGATTTVFDTASLKPIKVLQMAADGMDFRRLTK